MHYQIPPHGGELVNRVLRGSEREFWAEKGMSLPSITVDARTLCDIEMIACGAMSPLEGFMCRDEYNHVIDHMRLSSGLPWPLPVVLGVSRDQADDFDVDSPIALKDASGALIAILHLEEIFVVNKEKEAAKVFKTGDTAHPGVSYILEKRGDVLVGGDIDVINMPAHTDFAEYRLTPLETRHAFEKRGWARIVGFQTRNPLHRAHEYVQKCALEFCDGLLVHPLFDGQKEEGISVAARMESYKALIENHFPEEHVILAIFPCAKRYAGPREAVFHAIVRKNYGCTHFIVGRDHAGVGRYYAGREAQEIFKEFGPHELDIVPMFFDQVVHCRKCGTMVTPKTCPHDVDEHVAYSGSALREMLLRGERPPVEFTRPEVADILMKSVRTPAG